MKPVFEGSSADKSNAYLCLTPHITPGKTFLFERSIKYFWNFNMIKSIHKVQGINVHGSMVIYSYKPIACTNNEMVHYTLCWVNSWMSCSHAEGLPPYSNHAPICECLITVSISYFQFNLTNPLEDPRGARDMRTPVFHFISFSCRFRKNLAKSQVFH